jgi:hypothetical protein
MSGLLRRIIFWSLARTGAAVAPPVTGAGSLDFSKASNSALIAAI